MDSSETESTELNLKIHRSTLKLVILSSPQWANSLHIYLVSVCDISSSQMIKLEIWASSLVLFSFILLVHSIPCSANLTCDVSLSTKLSWFSLYFYFHNHYTLLMPVVYSTIIHLISYQSFLHKQSFRVIVKQVILTNSLVKRKGKQKWMLFRAMSGGVFWFQDRLTIAEVLIDLWN